MNLIPEMIENRKAAMMSPKSEKSSRMAMPKGISMQNFSEGKFLSQLKGMGKRLKKLARKPKRMMSKNAIMSMVLKKIDKNSFMKLIKQQSLKAPKGKSQMASFRRGRCRPVKYFSPCYCQWWDWCCIWRSIQNLVWYLYQLHWYFTWYYGCFWGKIYTIRVLWRILWRCPWWLRRWLWRLLINLIWGWSC